MYESWEEQQWSWIDCRTMSKSRLGLFEGVAQCNHWHVLAFSPGLERRESGTTGQVEGAAAASDFRIEAEMRLNLTLYFWDFLNRVLFSPSRLPY